MANAAPPAAQKKHITTSRGLTYAYTIYPAPSSPSNDAKPPLLLLHGFPDSSLLWTPMLPYLTQTGHTLLVPDLLGYGETSKPTDAAMYDFRLMAHDLAELLDAEGVRAAVPLGHDWGSVLAQRLYLWHPERVAALGLLNVAYSPPRAEPFDLAGMLEATTRALGYPLFEYWTFFTAPDAAGIIQDHLESFYTVLHGDPQDWMRTMLCTPGALRTYLLADKRVPLAPYITSFPAYSTDFHTRYTRDGLTAPLQWYVAMTTNVPYAAEAALPPERARVRRPVLFVGCSRDPVCLAKGIEAPREAGLLPDLEIKECEARHWCPLERPEVVGGFVGEWLEGRPWLREVE